MIARIFIFICLTVFCVTGNAQKTDYNWLAGYFSNGYDTGWHYWFDITKFDFNQTPVVISRDSLGMNFNRSNSMISDSEGNLLFYCNGASIRNRWDVVVENGDSLSASYLFVNMDPEDLILGIPFNQYHIVLPNPQKPYGYDLFYGYMDTFNVINDLASKKIMRASLDMSANMGHGLVTRKDSSVLERLNGATVAAVKHANGRDWWICVSEADKNCYDVLRYDGGEVLPVQVYCDGGVNRHLDVISERFSPDGSKFIAASYLGGINIFDFDRCNGQLSLKEHFVIPEIVDSFDWWPTAIEFSPNGRYAYIFCSARIYQLDMYATPIGANYIAIGKYSGFNGPNPQTYFHAQLAPNGKIYVNSGNSNYYISVIDNPDGADTTCHFLDHGIQLPSFIIGLPYFPNYRLGALPGSPCDTLTGLNDDVRADKEKIIKVFPNPATDMITFDYGFTDWSKGAITLEINNELGQVVYTQKLPMYSGFQKIDVSNYAPGMYTAFIKRNDSIVATSKFVKE
jgi:WD40 repeat protein